METSFAKMKTICAQLGVAVCVRAAQRETICTKMRTICAQLGAAVCVRVCVRVRVCAQTGARFAQNQKNTRFVTTQKMSKAPSQ